MKKLFLSLVFIPVLLNANIYKFNFCGGYYEDGSRSILLLDQTLVSDPSLYPFLNCLDSDFCAPFGNATNVVSYDNLDEWENYFNHKISKEALRKGFYQTPFLDFDKFLKDHTSEEYVPRNELERFILASSNKKELLHYFWFAKKCELIYTGKYQLENSWYQGESIVNSQQDLKSMFEEAKELYSETQDAFLKNRIGFQIVRLAFELGNPERANEMFDTYMKYDESSKYIYYKAMERNATMLYRRGKKVESLQSFQQVFENLQDRKDAVFLSLQRLPMRGLAVKKNSSENELLHFFYGFHGDHIAELKELVEINPNSAYAEVLAMRYFDSLHEAFFSAILSGEIEESLYEGVAKAEAVVASQLSNSTVKNKELWSIFKGIIEIVKRDYDSATATFTQNYRNTAYKNQADIFAYSIKVLQMNVFDKYTMDRLFLELKGNKNLYRNHGVRGFYFKKIGQLYANVDQKIISKFLSYQSKHYSKNKVDKNDALGANFDASSFFYEQHTYLEETDLLKLKELITVTSRTGLEHFIVSLLPNDKEDFINEMLGTYFLRENQLDSAINYFSQIKQSKKYYQKGIRNSLFSAAANEYFNVNFLEQSDRFHENYKDLLYPSEINKENYVDNKLLLAQTLMKLEKLALEDPRNAGAYNYMLGNAWYNLSELGWFVNTLHYLNEGNDGRNSIIGYDDWANEDAEFDSEMIENAVFYYDKAIETATSNEIKAKATFFKAKAAMCFDITWSDSNSNYVVGDFCGDHAANFEELAAYKDTKFYKEIIKECTYFKAYTQRK